MAVTSLSDPKSSALSTSQAPKKKEAGETLDATSATSSAGNDSNGDAAVVKLSGGSSEKTLGSNSAPKAKEKESANEQATDSGSESEEKSGTSFEA